MWNVKGLKNETNIPTFSNEKKTYPWISCAHENPRRSCCDSSSPSKGSGPLKCLMIWIYFDWFFEIHSLSKNYRLHTAVEFAATIKLRHQACGYFIQIYAKPNDLTHARLGMIVAKKIERYAVKRNWIKRILRETFRQNRSSESMNNMDWVIKLRRKVSRKDSAQLVVEMKTLMFQLQQCHE